MLQRKPTVPPAHFPKSSEHWRLVLTALGAASRVFAATLRSRPALQEFLRCALDLVQGDAGSIMLLDREGTGLEVVVAEGHRADVILGRRQALSESIAVLAARSGEPVVLKGAEQGLSAYPQDFAWSVVTPMVMSGRLIGVMSISCIEAKPLDPSVAGQLTLLSRQAGIFVEAGRLYEEQDRRQRRLELLLDELLDRDSEKQAIPAGIHRPPRVPGSPPGLETRSAATSAGPDHGVSPPIGALTRREQQVLNLLAEGNSNKRIASALYISVPTVKSHVREVIAKLGAEDRTQAVIIALRLRLVS